MKKKHGIAVAVAMLAAVLTADCGAKKVEGAASAAEGTAAAMSSVGESAASNAALKDESATSEDERKFADFRAEDFEAGDDITVQAEAVAQILVEKHEKLTVADGTYRVNMMLSGSSGRTKIAGPTEFTVKDGRAAAKVVWSSDKYGYMEVESIRFTPEIQNGHSAFMVSVTGLDKLLAMVGDTAVMSTSHTTGYQLTLELQR